MHKYIVNWQVKVDAESTLQAAEYASLLQKNVECPLVFDVVTLDGEGLANAITKVDLVHLTQVSSPISNGLSDELDGMLGAKIAEVFKLQRDPDQPDRWATEWGNKTDAGLTRTLRRMVMGFDAAHRVKT